MVMSKNFYCSVLYPFQLIDTFEGTILDHNDTTEEDALRDKQCTYV